MPLGKHHLLTLNQLHHLAENQEKLSLDFESMAKNILNVIQRVISFDAAWVLRFDPKSFNIQSIFLYHFNQRAFSKYLDDHYTHAPIPTLRQIKNESFISKKGSDLIEEEIWEKSLFYLEIIKPLGLHFFLTSACITVQQEYTGYMVFWRSSSRNDFSSQDCFFLEQASPYTANILNQIKIEDKETEKSEVMKLVRKRLNPGVLILSKGNEITFINQEAKNILSIIRSGKAYLSNKDDERFIQTLYSLKERTLQNLLLARQSSDLTDLSHVFVFRGTIYSCRAILLEASPAHEGSVMILIETVQEESTASTRYNKHFSDFTAREKAVANLVGKGMTNKEIASELGIGIHTVKDHIKNIMGKLNTRTRSGIVSRLMVK